MDPVKAFRQEREQTIASYRQDEPFEQLSQRFLQSSMEKRYVYNFDWLGRPVIQYDLGARTAQKPVEPPVVKKERGFRYVRRPHDSHRRPVHHHGVSG